MFYRSSCEVTERIEYTKLKDNSWRADYRGFADVSVQEKTLEACRSKIFGEIDAALLTYLRNCHEAGARTHAAPRVRRR